MPYTNIDLEEDTPLVKSLKQQAHLIEKTIAMMPMAEVGDKRWQQEIQQLQRIRAILGTIS